MNKTMMWVIGIVILVVVGGGLFVANQQSQKAEEAKMVQEKDAMMKKEDTAMMGKGYVMKNGSMMVEENREFSPMTQSVTLKDGTKVMTNGQVVKADGTTLALKDGQSIWEDGSMTDEKMTKTDDKVMDKSASSRYAEYSKAVLDQAAASRRVLYFYANWCPICKPADADFKANSSKIPSDVTVIRVNYNDTDTDQEEKDLAKKYGITYQHTFVQIDGQGKEITKWNGGKTDELLTNLK